MPAHDPKSAPMVPPADVAIGPHRLPGDLWTAPGAVGLVLFAHGSGSSRHSPRNRRVARALQARGLATLLFDLLDDDEAQDRAKVFDIALLAGRVGEALAWVRADPRLARLPVGLFGASTGAAAALYAAAEPAAGVQAVVSRGGRPDLALDALPHVHAATLLIVGGDDTVLLAPHRQAFAALRCPKRLEIVPGASHLFEEPGTLEVVTALAAAWFEAHLRGPLPRS